MRLAKPKLDADSLHVSVFVTDHAGTPRKLINQWGETVWEAGADDWGAVARERKWSTTTQPIRFQGQWLDEESGFYYNRFRYYDPRMGRYITQDPIGLAGGMNLYGYVHGNPISYIDPLGLAEAGLYYCRRPVDGVPGDSLNSVLNHHYICTINDEGEENCKGLTHADPSDRPKPLKSYDGIIAGADRGDYYHPGACKKLGDDEVDSSCSEGMLKSIGARPAPTFGIRPGLTDCQEWAGATASEISRRCNNEVIAGQYRAGSAGGKVLDSTHPDFDPPGTLENSSLGIRLGQWKHDLLEQKQDHTEQE
jgi:RHS repeat-associated protein